MVDEINEPVFVDIPTLVAVLIKPDDSLHESSARIEEICSDEVQEDSIDVDFIEVGNENYEEPRTKLDDDDPNEHSNSTNFYNVPNDLEINELHRISSECSPSNTTLRNRDKSRGKFSKQNSIDLSSSNLNVSRKFGSIEGISKSKESTLSLQRSHTNLEKRPALPERGKKLNNIREIDDRKTNVKSEIWRAIGNVGSKDHLQRKSSNESDKSLKDSNSSKAIAYGHSIGRKPSLESLKRKTSKDSSSSSSKDEQILISSLTRDKLLRRKNSLDHEAVSAATSGAKHHTTIQKVKRAEIVAAVTERLYSSKKHTEESNMASNSASGTRSPPESTDIKMTSSSGLMARSRLQEISRKMLLRRRRINVETQTEAASTLRLRDAASLTEEPKVVLQDAAVLTDDHADYVMRDAAVTDDAVDHRLPVLRVKDAATMTDRRPRVDIFRYKDAESLVNDLDFEEYESHSPRNDSGVLSDDTQNYADSNLSSAEMSEHYCHSEHDRKVLFTDSSSNTFLTLPAKNSAVQTTRAKATIDQQKANSESRSCSRCCSLMHEASQHTSASNPERNVISISLPDTISITIESTNGLESRIAVMDGTDALEERSKLVFNDKECQTDEQIRSEAEKSFVTDLTFKSTATQADGRVFRIENIFEDPKSKSCHEETSELKKDVATKKSVILRNSLGTSSIIGTKETGTETEWNGLHIEDAYHRKRAILKGCLTRAFIAKRRSYSLSPRRPAYRFIRHDMWKNWTLPCLRKSSGFINYGRETGTVPSSTQNINLGLVDNLSSKVSNEYTSADKIPKEPTRESSTERSRSDLKETKISLKSTLLECDHNFSDDSLDDDSNVTRKCADAKKTNSHARESHENLCPPDVVAHTKRKASKSANHVDLANVESLNEMNDDFDDTEVEFPRRKSTEISNKDPIDDYETLILGMSSYVDSDSEEETDVITTSDSISKKKVSFIDPSNPKEMTDVNCKILAKQDSEIALKSIIKKMMKPVMTESLKNVKSDQSLQGKQIEPRKSEDIPSTNKETQDSEDSRKIFGDKKIELSNEDCLEKPHDKTDSIVSNGTICSHQIPKRNILEEYLNEATTFMRNMNSINEYMSATSLLESYGKRRRKRGVRRGNNSTTNKDPTEFRGQRASSRDNTDLLSDQNGTAIKSYEKCLKSVERLEACIDKVGRHNQVLRNRYGIDVESAGAKSSLACPSIGSKMSSIDDTVIRKYGDVTAGNDIEDRDELRFFRISSPPLSSTQADDARRFTLSDTDRQKMISKIDEDDNDGSTNVTPEDDLERRIFNELMCAADSSSRCWNLRKSRHRQERFWKTDLRSRSPTTYSKFRETFRRDDCGILNFDEVSTAEDYLSDVSGIENSSRNFRKMKSLNTMIEIGDTDSKISSIGSVGDTARFRDEPLRENKASLKIKMPRESMILKTKMEYLGLTDPMRSIEMGQTSFAEEEIARKDREGSKDSLRIESMNLKFGGPLSVELKYPGSPRAKFLELLRERRRIVESSRGTNAF